MADHWKPLVKPPRTEVLCGEPVMKSSSDELQAHQIQIQTLDLGRGGLGEEIAFFHLRPLPLPTAPSGVSDPPWGLHKEEMKRKKSSSYFGILIHPWFLMPSERRLGFFLE